MVYGLFFIILFFVSLYLWLFPFGRRKTINVRFISEPATFSLILLCITGWIGSMTIYFLRSGNSFNKVVDNYTGNDGLVLILVTITVVFMTCTSKLNLKYINDLKCNSIGKISLVDWIMLSVVMSCLLYYVFVDWHYVSSMLSAANQYDIMALRKESTSVGSDYLFKKVIVEGVFWVSLLYYYSLKGKGKLFTFFLYLVTFVFCLFFFLSLKKISIVLLLVSIFLSANFNKSISFLHIMRLILVFFAIMFAIYFLLIRNVSWEYMLSPFEQGLVGRIFISEISSLYAHLAIFSNEHIGFESVSRSVSSLFGMVFSPRSGEVVMATVNPTWVEMGIGGTYNTLFIGEAFANFGFVGMLISIFYVSFYYILIVRTLVLFPVKFRIAMLVYLSLNVNIMSGFNDYIYNPFLVLIYCVILFRKLFVLKARKLHEQA